MSRYRGLLLWRSGKGCWEISVGDEKNKGIPVQPCGVFSEEELLSQLRVIAVPAARIEFTGYTCEVYPPEGMDRRKLGGQARRFIIMLHVRYLLHGGQRVEWRLYRQR